MKWIRVQGKKKLTPGVCRYRWPETEKWEYQINDPFNISHLYGKEVEIIDKPTPPEKTYSEEELKAEYKRGYNDGASDAYAGNTF